MKWKVLKTEADYQKAVLRTIQIFDTEPKSLENDELEILLVLVKEYEDKHVVVPSS